jgi:hypothetical protein
VVCQHEKRDVGLIVRVRERECMLVDSHGSNHENVPVHT